MGKPLRITLIVTGLLLTLLVVGAVVVPLLFEDRIVQLLRTELNERLDAEVELADVDLSFLSTFPTFTAEVTELTVTGKGEFEGVQLLRASSVGAGLDLLALLFEDRIRITSVTVDQPDVHVIITKEGAANYDILGDLVEPSEDDEDAEDQLVFEIERYTVNEGQIHYEEPGVDVLATSVNHDGRLRVAEDHEELSSKTRIEELSIRLGGIRYLKKAWVGVEIDGVLESERARLTLNAIKVMVNRLAIEGLGSIAWSGEGTEVDLTFASPEGLPIKALISAVPNAYAADFDGLQASGSFGLRGTVRGQLGPDDNDIPSFAVSARVRGGALKYPDLPLGLTDIELDATLDHPGGHLDKLKVNVPKYGLRAAKSHANGSLRLSRPLSGPDLVLALDGRFDLAEIAKAYPIPEVEGLAGLVEARVDLSAQGERVEKLAGSISARDVSYRSSDGQGVSVSEARVDLSPASTTIQALRAKVGTSDVSVRGVTSPLTTFLSDGQKITASLWLTSNRLRVEDFLGESEETPTGKGEDTQAPFLLPDNLDAKLDLDVKTLTYGDLVLESFKGSGRIRNQKLILEGVRANALGGSMKLDGTLTTRPNRPATFDMTYSVDKVSFAKAFDALPSMRAYAPIARYLDGRFSTDLQASGTLGDDLSPKLDSVNAGGLVAALQTKLSSDFKPLQMLTGAVPAIPKPLSVEGFKTRFAIKDGGVEVKPFTATAKGLTMSVSGRHGLDQEMRYRVSTEVPIDSLTSKLSAEVKKLGIDVAKVKNVGVNADLTGSIKNPRVSVNVDTGGLRSAAADALSTELAEQRVRALEEAQKQGARLVAEAEKQAERIRSEAKRAAEKVRKEGYAGADQVEREAAGNPIAEIAAREGAKRIRSETDKRVNQAIEEADRRADQAVAEAKKREAALIKEAAIRSQQATDQVEKQTSEKLR